MTIEEYVNVNLKNIIVRGFGKDAEYTVKLKGIEGRQFRVTFVILKDIPQLLRIDIPIEGVVLTLIGNFVEKDEDDYVYLIFDKAGILQRRAKPRYAAFKECTIFGFKSVILDVSENGFQAISEYKPTLREDIEIDLLGNSEKGTVMWVVEEEEYYRFGVYIESPSENWKGIYEKYYNMGEKL